MKHKWHKEIKAWADGAEIERWYWQYGGWGKALNPNWDERYEFRIKPQPKEEYSLQDLLRDFKEVNLASEEFKALFDRGEPYKSRPQPKEPQYLYVYADLEWDMSSYYKVCGKKGDFGTYIGKIKLEVDDD